ncbi:hypothetical protein Tco_1225575, partial [Tanacetum coccineum]
MMIICGNKLLDKDVYVVQQYIVAVNTHKNKVPCRIEIKNTIDKSAYAILVKSLLQRWDLAIPLEVIPRDPDEVFYSSESLNSWVPLVDWQDTVNISGSLRTSM